MSRSKNYNRIVFLTTLSVYLGLILVGGTAPVLAHSALTKSFDIHNEIETKDDLDNKPDDESAEIFTADFPKLLSEFISEIKTDSDTGRIKNPLPDIFGSQGFITLYDDSSGASSGYESNDTLGDISNNFIGSKILNATIRTADFKDSYKENNFVGSTKEAKAKIEVDKSNLVLEISFSKLKPEIFAAFLNAKYASLSKETEDRKLKKFYENTKVSSENNQVFIVTHLPRAALDEFLARKDAQ